MGTLLIVLVIDQIHHKLEKPQYLFQHKVLFFVQVPIINNYCNRSINIDVDTTLHTGPCNLFSIKVPWIMQTFHLIPSSCTLCQPVQIVSTTGKKYTLDNTI